MVESNSGLDDGDSFDLNTPLVVGGQFAGHNSAADSISAVMVCPVCSYDLRGLEPARCPECGWPLRSRESYTCMKVHRRRLHIRTILFPLFCFRPTLLWTRGVHPRRPAWRICFAVFASLLAAPLGYHLPALITGSAAATIMSSIRFSKLGNNGSERLLLEAIANKAQIMIDPVMILLTGSIVGSLLISVFILYFTEHAHAVRSFEVASCALVPTSLWFGILNYLSYILDVTASVFHRSSMQVRIAVLGVVIILIYGYYLGPGMQIRLGMKRSRIMGLAVAACAVSFTGGIMGIIVIANWPVFMP